MPNPNEPKLGLIDQTFVITKSTNCTLSYTATNNFNQPNTLAQGSITAILSNTGTSETVFFNVTGEFEGETINELLTLEPGTYNLAFEFNGDRDITNPNTESYVDNVSLVCDEVEFLECQVTLLPDFTPLNSLPPSAAIDPDVETACFPIPFSTDCKILRVQCEEYLLIADEIRFTLADGESRDFPFEITCSGRIDVTITTITPHNGSSILLITQGSNLSNSPNPQGFIENFGLPYPRTENITITNNSGSQQEYILMIERTQQCVRETIGFKSSSDPCEEGCITIEWEDKCTGNVSKVILDGSMRLLSPEFVAEEYLSSLGVLSLTGKNKTNKIYELNTTGICDEIFCLISEASAEENFKVNGVLVIPIGAGSYEGEGLRNAVFQFKKAELKDESCCC